MKLRLGPIVGAVSDREARIWLRADDPSEARVHVFRASGTEVPGSPFRANGASDPSGTATIVARLPSAYSRYTYDVRDAAGASVLPAWLGTPGFWSAPVPDTIGPFRFGVLSCNDMRPKAQRGRSPVQQERPWRTLFEKAGELDLAFLLCVGDQMYGDDAWAAETRGEIFPPTLRRAYEAAYQEQWDYRWFRRTLANFPTYMTWDDHDIRNGWGSERLDATARNRQEAFTVVREVYRRFQHDHNPPSFGGGADDLFYAFQYGNAGVLVLDGRGARDMEREADPLLGAHQWKQVTQWLRDETPGLEALFVVSSVPPVHVPPHLAKPSGPFASDIRDQWTWPGNLPELERLATELFDRANEHDIPIVLLGGDVHLGTVACLRSTRPEHAKRPILYQLCSSPITSAPPRLLVSIFEQIAQTEFRIAPGIRGKLLTGPLAERNFGVVELVYEPDRYRITLKLFDEMGKERVRYPLPG
jgi:phosphodiesterase/alkaline phosphatase D-like protein